MTHYLNWSFQDDENFISTFDEMPLWSAQFGLLLLEHLPLSANLKVLDAACGTGFPLFELAGRLGPSSLLTGIDNWKTAMARARIKLRNYGFPNVTLVEESAEQMPFADHTFDLIVSNLGINNMGNPAAFMREAKRVLKPGGMLALTTNLTGHWKEFYEVFRYTLEEEKLHSVLPALQEHEAHRGTAEGIAQLFAEAGFTPPRLIQRTFTMRFVDGSALLHHPFIKLGWLGSWKALIPQEKLQPFFAALEKNLNTLAKKEGNLRLTVPGLYAEGSA